MENIAKIYFINLDTRPDRYEHFLQQCDYHSIDFLKIERFKAIDGNTYNFTDHELHLFKNVDYKFQPYAKKIMGNQLSHYYILKEMIKKNYKYIIICQDDIIFKNNFANEISNIINNIPYDAEIINIAFFKFASFSQFIPWDIQNNKDDHLLKKNTINDHIIVLNDTINPCSLGYIVTLQGANNITKYFENIGFRRATDWNFNEYLISKNIFYGSQIVLGTGNTSFKSDIFI